MSETLKQISEDAKSHYNTYKQAFVERDAIHEEVRSEKYKKERAERRRDELIKRFGEAYLTRKIDYSKISTDPMIPKRANVEYQSLPKTEWLTQIISRLEEEAEAIVPSALSASTDHYKENQEAYFDIAAIDAYMEGIQLNIDHPLHS